MQLSRRAVVCFAAGSCVLLTCCSPFSPVDVADPLGVMAHAARKRSGVFQIRDDPPPRLRPRRLPEGELSLEQCVAIAIRYSPRSRQSLQLVRAQQARLGQTRGLYWPRMNASMGRTRSKVQALDGGNASIRDRYEMGVSANWTLFDFGLRRSAVQAALATLRGAAGEHGGQLLDIALAAEVSYFGLQRAEALLEVVRITDRQRARHLELARRLSEAGLERTTDLRKAEAALVDARVQVEIARGVLASVMGFAPSAPVRVRSLRAVRRAVGPEAVDQLLDKAGKNRPRLRALAAEITRLRHEVALQRAARLPELSLAAAYGLKDAHLLIDAGRNEWTAALNLSMELLTGFQRTYRIRELRERVEAAINGYEDQLRAVELEVWRAYSDIVGAEEAIGAAAKFIESAQESLTTTEREYREGRVGIVALEDAQETHTRAMFAEVRAQLDFDTAVARLRRALGEGLENVPGELRQ